MNNTEFGSLDHELFMSQALHEGDLAGQNGERPIGAVIVHNGEVIGLGRASHLNRRSKIAHAEMNALFGAEQYIFAHQHDGLVLYTTVEPCVMCLGTIVMSDIDHIVFALPDRWINPAWMLDMPYIKKHVRHYVGGVLENESIELFTKYRPDELNLIQGMYTAG